VKKGLEGKAIYLSNFHFSVLFFLANKNAFISRSLLRYNIFSVRHTSPTMAANTEDPPKPWYTAYPTPQITASSVTRETLLSWMKDGKRAGKDFVLVDLRRTDYEVSF
jgi:hypothetical protein